MINDEILRIADDKIGEAMREFDETDTLAPRAILVTKSQIHSMNLGTENNPKAALRAVRQYTSALNPTAIIFISHAHIAKRSTVILTDAPTHEVIGCMIETPTEAARKIIIINRTKKRLEDQGWGITPPGEDNPFSDFYQYLKPKKIINAG